MIDFLSQFDRNRKVLADQYVTRWHNEEAYRRTDALFALMVSFADTIPDEPHPVIKAKCFDFLLTNAPIVLNPDDPFGILPEAAKMQVIYDTGCPYTRGFDSVREQWKAELDGKLNLQRDAEFVKYAKNHLLNEFYLDFNHSTPCWEDIFSLGITGILERAEEYREKLSPLNRKQTAFFDGISISYRAMLKLFKRYLDVLENRTEPYPVMMREAFRHLLVAPPSNTYEALLLSFTIWFVWEQVDCFRVRSSGAIDRLYLGFYRNDIESARFTKEELKGLFVYYMNAFHAARAHYQQPMYVGGIDKDGNCIVNELSYLFLDAYDFLSAPNPKLQIKISKNTPEPFLRRVAEVIRGGNSSISIINDDNAVKALLKFGVTKEEAYTSLMSGCWDYAIRNHEVKTIPVRSSLPKILEYTMANGYCLTTGGKVGCEVGEEFDTFEDFLLAFEKQYRYVWERVKGIIENWELYLDQVSPSNLYSGTMTDALSRGVDGYARGMKYNNTVYTICSLATLVDSLCAIKKYVFDKKELTVREFVGVLKNNWSGYEDLRNRILHDPDKYGNGSSLADEITVRLTKYFGELTNGVPNSRGGVWKLGMLTIDKNVRFGALACASPDGRLAGEPFSKNLSPVIGMDRNGVTALLNSVGKIDFTEFPHAGMLDLILHPSAVSGEDGLSAFCAIIRTYFAKGGHSLQFNIFSAEMLKNAKREPEKYRNLQIRVCGWNVYFVDLEPVLQDCFIRECENREATGM